MIQGIKNFTPLTTIKKSDKKAEVKTEHSIQFDDRLQINSFVPLETPKNSVKTLCSGFGYTEFPQVSPDGEKIIFNVVGNYTTSQMLEMDSDGNNIRSLFTKERLSPENIGDFLKKYEGKIDEQGTWSHDGKTIYYRSNEKGTFGIASYDVEKDKQKLLLHNQNMNLKHPVETENGYITGYGGEPGEKFKTSEKFSDIFIGNPSDGSYHFITHSNGSVAYKHPSTINGLIMAHKEDKSNKDISDIVTLDPKTGEEVNLTNTPKADEKHPFYNKNINLLAFHSDETGDKNIWISTPEGDKRCQLTFYGKAAQSPCWSPDGKKIYFVKKGDAIPENEPFYNRQAEIKVINVRKALKELTKQAKDMVENLKSIGADRKAIEIAKEEYHTYKYFLEKYEEE